MTLKGIGDETLFSIRTTPTAPPWFAAAPLGCVCVIGAASQGGATGSWAGKFLDELIPKCDRRQSDAICTSRVEMAFRLWECSLPLRKRPCIWTLWKTLPISISLSLSPGEASSGLTLDMELDDLLSMVQRGGDLANVGPLVLQSEAG